MNVFLFLLKLYNANQLYKGAKYTQFNFCLKTISLNQNPSSMFER